MIITHQSLAAQTSSSIKSKHFALNRHEIALFAHTNGDVAQDGVGTKVQALELSDASKYFHPKVKYLGRIGSIKPIPLREFVYTVAGDAKDQRASGRSNPQLRSDVAVRS